MLEAGGQSLLLKRAAAAATIAIPAPSIGTVAAPSPGTTLPQPGDRVARGQTFLTLRRFKTLIEVASPCDGELATVDVAPGQFVEFGQALARIIPS